MPTPIRWQVPTELSPEEARVAAKLRRIGKFYALDLDWSDPAAHADALTRVLAEVDRLEQWVTAHVPSRTRRRCRPRSPRSAAS
jgi:hypothetical protein